ncbi:MAG: SprT-like domain-containing protein [Bacteroidales bacterium]|nr:SprT-like domain-containing protein [Bacteroidales bacterium]
MIATIDYATKKFHEYNVQMFGGELPLPAIFASKARTYLGRYECDVRHKLFGRTERYNHRIRINTVQDFPEEEIDDIIIHEMIHYFISFKGLHDTSAHGRIFRSMMADINARFGRNISISKRRTKQMIEEDTRVRRHYICVMTLADGRTLFTPVTEQSVRTLWQQLPKAWEAKSAKWLTTCDPFFNSYRRMSCGRRLPARYRAYPADPQKLANALADAVELIL